MSDKIMLTIPEAARILNVSVAFVGDLIREGTLDCHRHVMSDEVFECKRQLWDDSYNARKKMAKLSEDIEHE